MASAVTTSRLLREDLYEAEYLFTATFTDTQESAAKKVDASTLNNATSANPLVSIKEIEWNCTGSGTITVLFDASSDVTAMLLTSYGNAKLRSPLTNNAGAGVTGDILFTTSGFASGGGYEVKLVVKKEQAYFSDAPNVTALVENDTNSGIYKTGDTISLKATYDQVINNDSASSGIDIVLGSGTVHAGYPGERVVSATETGNGTKLSLYEYTVKATDVADPGDVSLGDISGIRGSGVGTLPVVDALPTLDTSGWTVNHADVATASGITNGHAYSTGDQITLTLTFDYAVDVDATNGTPRVPMHINAGIKQAAYNSGTGTTALVFKTAAPGAGDVATAGQFTVAAAIDLNGGKINDHVTAIPVNTAFTAPTTTTVTVN